MTFFIQKCATRGRSSNCSRLQSNLLFRQ